MTALRYRSVGQTDPGRKRPHNEDAFLRDDALGLWVVADGVGGQARGEVASSEAVDQLHSFVRQARGSLDGLRARTGEGDRAAVSEARRLLESAVQSACYLVFGMGEVDPDQRGMSTTISALLHVGTVAVTAQVGDSRVYRVRDGASEQLTEDHTLVNEQLKQGILTPEAAKTAKKNVITRAVGHKDYVQVDTAAVDAKPGDCFLLCSDGLHGYLLPGEVETELAAGAVDEAPTRFIALANGRGGKDNITAVVVVVE